MASEESTKVSRLHTKASRRERRGECRSADGHQKQKMRHDETGKNSQGRRSKVPTDGHGDFGSNDLPTELIEERASGGGLSDLSRCRWRDSGTRAQSRSEERGEEL
jgi:hypothetical protein